MTSISAPIVPNVSLYLAAIMLAANHLRRGAAATTPKQRRHTVKTVGELEKSSRLYRAGGWRPCGRWWCGFTAGRLHQGNAQVVPQNLVDLCRDEGKPCAIDTGSRRRRSCRSHPGNRRPPSAGSAAMAAKVVQTRSGSHRRDRRLGRRLPDAG